MFTSTMHARPLLGVLRGQTPLAELTVQVIELSVKYFQGDDFMPDARGGALPPFLSTTYRRLPYRILHGRVGRCSFRVV